MMEATQEPKSKSVIVNIILKRLWALNANWICLITGGTGSGKSYCALRFASQIDKTFNIKRVCFSLEEFFQLYNSGELSKGKVVVIDEAGAALSARRWNSEGNKDMMELLQVCRHRQFAIIFCVPSLSFVDIAVQRMAHSWIITNSIDRKLKQCKVKFFWLNWDDRRKRLYTRYHVVKRPNGSKQQIRIMRIEYPDNPKLIEAYELKKREFTKNLGQRSADRLDSRNNPQPRNTGPTKKQLIEAELSKGTKPLDIAVKYDTDPAYVRQIRLRLPK